ncbi:Calcium-transporting ATPase 8, plasma membrane-type [Arachis hypogaea]|uniref:Calcium-transporting ATPase 8, plasma membrane-type n=1 Tax=Arachis hypogaea TaxID=3818 RepID=A0A6B9VFC3_ARAHY|nr:Calcium-transporting ATPase 8, plasma membrane-type [Arachis hypogaea]
MGRSSPNDKLLLVQALRRKGHVVAVTGDGTNDAPALHEADIGCGWGRSVYANIQKFIQFQLTVNVAALVINVVAAVSSGDVPLNAVQLLWVNLIMDTLGALALATEPPTDHLMAMYQVSVLLVLNFRGRSILGLTHDKNDHAIKVKNTLIFNAFVLSQIREFTSTVRLNWKQWLISVIIGFISWPLAVVGKLIPVPNTPINNVFSRFRG